MTNAMKTRSRSARIDMSRSEIRSVAYRPKMNSIGAIEVKNALLKSRVQKSWVPRELAPARMTKSASDVRNGLQTVETIRATSVHARLRIRSGVGAEGWACTGMGLRPSPSKPPG